MNTTVYKKGIKWSYLQRHKKTLALNIREAEIDTTRIAIDVPIAHYMLHLRVDALNETI
jgi:hypothetical protein